MSKPDRRVAATPKLLRRETSSQRAAPAVKTIAVTFIISTHLLAPSRKATAAATTTTIIRLILIIIIIIIIIIIMTIIITIVTIITIMVMT